MRECIAAVCLAVAAQMLAVAGSQSEQIDAASFTVASLLAQSAVMLDSVASLESWWGREWWCYPRYAAVDRTEAVLISHGP